MVERRRMTRRSPVIARGAAAAPVVERHCWTVSAIPCC
jgi:hypothetical protein